MNTCPKITVVTVTYNAREHVAETLESVIDQVYQNVEYIVVDGNSTDGTQQIINKYLNDLAVFISEPDKGIYDAMNKAIDFATGEWIVFINAGDYFADRATLSNIFSNEIDGKYDFIYGDYIWKDNEGEKRILSRPLDLMWQKISFSHQSLFARTELMKKKKFDLKYKIVSDYNFYFTCYMDGHCFYKVALPVSVFRAGGLSNVNFFQRSLERWSVVKRYNNRLKVHIYYLRLILFHYTKKILAAF